MENLDDKTQEILEIAAVVHDIGIHVCEEKYGHCSGDLQEKEGPVIAQKMLSELGFSDELIERVSFLIAHHHTYNANSIDWQILLESDFLVNGLEDNLSKEALTAGYKNIFKTESGKDLCKKMFGL